MARYVLLPSAGDRQRPSRARSSFKFALTGTPSAKSHRRLLRLGYRRVPTVDFTDATSRMCLGMKRLSMNRYWLALGISHRLMEDVYKGLFIPAGVVVVDNRSASWLCWLILTID